MINPRQNSKLHRDHPIPTAISPKVYSTIGSKKKKNKNLNKFYLL